MSQGIYKGLGCLQFIVSAVFIECECVLICIDEKKPVLKLHKEDFTICVPCTGRMTQNYYLELLARSKNKKLPDLSLFVLFVHIYLHRSADLAEVSHF